MLTKSHRGKKIAYLTFDDGPLRYTEAILNQLGRYGVKATFFVVGNSTPYGIQMYRRMVREGHAIGNHTYSHEFTSIYSSVPAFLKDFQQLESFLQRLTKKKPAIFRFPGGTNNKTSRKYGSKRLMSALTSVMTRKGYRYFDWNVDSGDAEKPKKTAKALIRNVLQGCKHKRKIIVLFHDFNKATPSALPAIIKDLKQQGFLFRTLSKKSFYCQFKP
jgi:peptidoglycan/xylan/chitin deacetylase (PgdA/CDA1 family)